MKVDPDVPLYQFKQWDGKLVREWRQLKFKDGVDPSAVVFATGYADDAIRSFALFQRLQGAGVIPTGGEISGLCGNAPGHYLHVYRAARRRGLRAGSILPASDC